MKHDKLKSIDTLPPGTTLSVYLSRALAVEVRGKIEKTKFSFSELVSQLLTEWVKK